MSFIDDMTAGLEALEAKYGQPNVERAAIFITELRDFKGLHIWLDASPEKIRRVLEVAYGEVSDLEF